MCGWVGCMCVRGRIASVHPEIHTVLGSLLSSSPVFSHEAEKQLGSEAGV